MGYRRDLSTGAGAINRIITPSTDFLVEEVRIHLESDGATTDESFVTSIGALSGEVFDAVFDSKKLIGAADYSWLPGFDPEYNWIDRWECESATPPMIFGETVPNLQDATFDRSVAQASQGASSYKFTKAIEAGTVSYVYFVDAVSAADMHGTLAGGKYILSGWVYIPAGGILGTEIYIRLADNDGGGFVTIESAATNNYDAWQFITVAKILQGDAAGVFAGLRTAGTAAINEIFYIDNVKLIGPRSAKPQLGRRGDSIKIAWPNSEAIEYGLEVIWQAA